MTVTGDTRQASVPAWIVLLVAVAALVVATAALTATLVGGTPGTAGSPAGAGWGPGWMMGGAYGPGGMMGGNGYGPGTTANGPLPGDAGFVAGTVASPRVIRVVAGPGYTFSPAAITVARGETVTFEVLTVGPLVHEFMVGPADAVAADLEGTPEIADIGMMQTRSLTYAFEGGGPYAFACHATGHYEAGMRGTVTVVG